MVQTLEPILFIKEPSFLSIDGLVHILHHEADAMG